ncbi:hypothetical protein SAMN05660776_2937 [Salegentibacter holothuriorum]|uniref:Lipoprotein n=1 Tax=Salegentibacter holothuriorum TaxID=241145 RepID=A0A1T5E0G0_9FLAO|nr:hypothetical protein [Salegentibacter holothuriorum]SKB77518.1 hypothetical protein SAMN05660776_2937 [Salegentibacter holothuriorum]
MKNFLRLFVAPFFLIICLLVGCSDDDALREAQEEEFLSAQIDGRDFMMYRIEGVVFCKKHLNDYGGIDLLIKAETTKGEIIEIFVTDYVGPKKYIFGHNKLNKGWMRYGLVNPASDWFSFVGNRQVQSFHPFIQIQEDDGNYLKGSFGFSAHNSIDNSIKLVSNGSFNFRLDSELD